MYVFPDCVTIHDGMYDMAVQPPGTKQRPLLITCSPTPSTASESWPSTPWDRANQARHPTASSPLGNVREINSNIHLCGSELHSRYFFIINVLEDTG